MSRSTAHRHGRRRRAAFGMGAVAVVAVGILLVPGGAGDRAAAAATLTPFEDCAALETWYADAADQAWGGASPIEQWNASREESAAGGADDAGPVPGAAVRAGGAEGSGAEAPAAGGLDAPAAGPGRTGTNVQEEGVDEPDLVKTDGETVITVRQGRLVATDVTGDRPRRLGDLALPRGEATDLLLVGNRALVLGTDWVPVPGRGPVEPQGGGAGAYLGGAEPGAPGADAPAVAEIWPAGTGTAVLTVVDLADPTRPEVVRTEELEGTYVSAREHDGAVRVVLSSQPALQFPPPGPAEARNWLPRRVERDATGAVTDRTPLLHCAAVRHPVEPAGTGMITVLTLDLEDRDAPITDRTGVAADGDLVYASTDRLYVATTRGGWIRPMAVTSLPGALTTQLHAFDVTGRTDTPYVASGEVEGWLLGRWAMSEHDGLLRVATTRDGTGVRADGAPDTDSAVSVLAERGDELTVVGSVGGLGKGEQIHAVRWFGTVATVVTFRQTDPLYTVDLSDPQAPRVLGELKISGYSAYLHPLGDGLLLGVGQDATDTGMTLGVQVSTFDLTDLTRPQRIDTADVPGGWSDVESDSRAFTYLPDRRLALVPVTELRTTLWALRVGADGSLATAGTWEAGADAWLVRAVPVGGDRVAVVTDRFDGSRLTLLALEDLRELGGTAL